jgi:hypothetical protein
MNAKNTMPGFTAENAIFEVRTHYRTGGVFDRQSGSEFVHPAMRNACENIWDAFMEARAGSPEEIVSINAYFAAGCP